MGTQGDSSRHRQKPASRGCRAASRPTPLPEASLTVDVELRKQALATWSTADENAALFFVQFILGSDARYHSFAKSKKRQQANHQLYSSVSFSSPPPPIALVDQVDQDEVSGAPEPL